MPTSFSYNKQEKLKSRKLLEEVFTKGQSFHIFPFKVFYISTNIELDFPIKAGVGASSKTFKKAVDRNYIKRLIREAYRLNKIPLHNYIHEHKKQLAVFILYVGKELPQLQQLQTKMPLVIDKLINAFNESATANT
ncbi:MAG: ribonuclease P protein component [Bacteroidetes bacterium]|nr:ribonuclease P protein component [Bacteroidota bacterium]MBS1649144.1 ribonuclease P protein component [Bacteroidota bacterium]